MPRKEYVLSAYRGMWLFAMFDLPTKTKEDRRRYARFRNTLLDEGFSMLQYSVYARYCANEQFNDAQRRRLREVMPPEGQVRLVSITDHQFGKQEVFCGKRPQEPENVPKQLLLF